MADLDSMCGDGSVLGQITIEQYPNIFDQDAVGMLCPAYSKFFGAMGASMAMGLSALGAAYGTAKAAEGMAVCGIAKPELLMKSLIPIVMAGIGAIYGLVVAVLISGSLVGTKYGAFKGFLDFGGGVAVGVSGLAAGYATGLAGDDGCRALCKQPRYFVGLILILVFAGVPGLYGLIVALLLTVRGGLSNCHAATYNPCCPNGGYLTFSQELVAVADQTTGLFCTIQM
eukprot:m.411175 g.411175  ORF g.411175 m.411175 type:complete len:228 (-) comp28585_c0_seq1:110-793(-)